MFKGNSNWNLISELYIALHPIENIITKFQLNFRQEPFSQKRYRENWVYTRERLTFVVNLGVGSWREENKEKLEGEMRRNRRDRKLVDVLQALKPLPTLSLPLSLCVYMFLLSALTVFYWTKYALSRTVCKAKRRSGREKRRWRRDAGGAGRGRNCGCEILFC